MSFDLDKAFEMDNGTIVDGAVSVSSLTGSIRSTKPTYTGDLLTKYEYFKSLTQTNPNRVATVDITYSGDKVSSALYTFYKADGVTVHSTRTETYTYSGDDVINIEEEV